MKMCCLLLYMILFNRYWTYNKKSRRTESAFYVYDIFLVLHLFVDIVPDRGKESFYDTVYIRCHESKDCKSSVYDVFHDSLTTYV